eukprot:1148579-Pelagomonas_calceolata.AAC.4
MLEASPLLPPVQAQMRAPEYMRQQLCTIHPPDVRRAAPVCKASAKESFGQLAASTLVATSLLAGVSSGPAEGVL